MIHPKSLFRYRVQSPSCGREEEEQGAAEPDGAPGRRGGGEGESTGVRLFSFLGRTKYKLVKHDFYWVISVVWTPHSKYVIHLN